MDITYGIIPFVAWLMAGSTLIIHEHVKTQTWMHQSGSSRSLPVNVLLFVLLVATLFNYLSYPSFGLDPSWRMAAGQFFHDGLQFGPEVMFTFGPLGFLYGNTYSGLQFWSLIFWQLLVASVFAIIIIDSARLLTSIRRVVYLAFFLLLSSTLIDALHLMIIALIGFELIRRSGEDWRPTTGWLVLFLALLAGIKFTNLLLACVTVLLVGAQELFRGRWLMALRLAACFLAGFLALWMACGQSLYNLPVYLDNSWQISRGYQQAMGLPTLEQPFWLGVAVVVALSAYGLHYLLLNFDRSRTLSRSVLLAAFIYLLWKHGFIRSDGHMFTFFVGALLPVVAFPAFLDDPPRRRWLAQWLLIPAGLLCVLGIYSTGMYTGWTDVIRRHVASRLEDRLWHHYDLLGQETSLRTSYEHQLEKEKQQFDLPRTREVIRQAPLDVLGYEQAIVLYNNFTYRPRPVFQSYSAYTPQLARLNDEFYRSTRAPDYALLKIQTIDNRFPTLDDSLLLRSFMHRYDYVHTELGFQLWKRRPESAREDSESTLVRSEAIKFNQPVELGELAEKRLWATMQLKPSLLGRLRNAVYKPPIINLVIEDTQGRRSTFRLTLPQAATGFILNPLIEDSVDYLCFAMGTANRQVHALTLEVPEKDRKFFSETAHLQLSELPSAPSGGNCRGLLGAGGL